jgi:hypothetical protein
MVKRYLARSKISPSQATRISLVCARLSLVKRSHAKSNAKMRRLASSLFANLVRSQMVVIRSPMAETNQVVTLEAINLEVVISQEVMNHPVVMTHLVDPLAETHLAVTLLLEGSHQVEVLQVETQLVESQLAENLNHQVKVLLLALMNQSMSQTSAPQIPMRYLLKNPVKNLLRSPSKSPLRNQRSPRNQLIRTKLKL